MSVPEPTVEREEVVVDSGLAYAEGEPVLSRIPKRVETSPALYDALLELE